jgi:hypothetical protein
LFDCLASAWFILLLPQPLYLGITRRNSLDGTRDVDDLSHRGEIVVDKRLGQRASAKKNRRNRHYEKQFIRNTLTHRSPADLTENIEQRDPIGPANPFR